MFYIKGRINKRNCTFKIDTDLDVTLIREGLLKFSKQQVSRHKLFNLRYPIGERVPVKFRVRILVKVGDLSMELPVYVVEMKDDCLLGNDFLSAMNFEETFASFLVFFGIPSQKKEEDSFCSRIMKETNRVPLFLKELFERENSGFK